MTELCRDMKDDDCLCFISFCWYFWLWWKSNQISWPIYAENQKIDNGSLLFLQLYVCVYILYINIYVSLEHKSSHKQHRYICSNRQQYIVWVKIIHFSFMPKIIRILRSCSIKIFCKCCLYIYIYLVLVFNIMK